MLDEVMTIFLLWNRNAGPTTNELNEGNAALPTHTHAPITHCTTLVMLIYLFIHLPRAPSSPSSPCPA